MGSLISFFRSVGEFVWENKEKGGRSGGQGGAGMEMVVLVFEEEEGYFGFKFWVLGFVTPQDFMH